MGSQILLQIGKGSVDGCKSFIDRFAEVLVKLFFVELRKLSPEEFDRRPETSPCLHWLRAVKGRP